MRKAVFTAITSLALLCSSAGSLAAEDAQLPTKPADGIRDDTRAFTDPQHAQLAAEMLKARQALPFDVWLVASTFLTSGENMRGYSRDLRRSWSGNGEAVLLAYDRASDKQFLAFSPGLWERYPPANLASMMQRSMLILAEKGRPLGDRLTQMMTETLARLKSLEKQHQAERQPMPAMHLHLAKFYLAGLGVAMCVLVIACGLLRRREYSTAVQWTFPIAEVPPRLGAPFGSRVTHL